jgi:hypothetical protein
MARIDPPLSPVPVAGIAEPHQSTVAAILRAVALGVFTVAQADIMIDRVRAHLTALPVALPSSVADGLPATVSGFAPDVLDGPDRTFR